MILATGRGRSKSLLSIENAWQTLRIVGVMAILPVWNDYEPTDALVISAWDGLVTIVYLILVDLVNSTVHYCSHKFVLVKKLMNHDQHHIYKSHSTSPLVGTHESWQALLMFTFTSVWVGRLVQVPLLGFLIGGLFYQTHVFLAHFRNRHRWLTAIGLNDGDSHLVHHVNTTYNYGIVFSWFDRLIGTYQDPDQWWTAKRALQWNS